MLCASTFWIARLIASRAAHMPEFHSGIVAALLENPYKVLSSCKHDCELSMTSLIAARAKKPFAGHILCKGRK